MTEKYIDFREKDLPNRKSDKNVALINGKLIEYDACCQDEEHLDYFDDCTKYEYLGTGVIYSVKGAIQPSQKIIYYFFNLKDKKHETS